MNRFTTYLFIIILCFVYELISAQQNNTLFLMQDMPQTNIVNPASSIKCKWYVGLPVLGSTHINQFSSGFSFNDFFETDNNGTLFLEPSNTIDKLNRLEVIAAEIHLSLFSLGYKHNQHYFTFAINEKANTYNIISKNTFLLAHKGNSQFEGKNANLDGIRVNGNHYREFALGWATKVKEGFDFGIKAKLLFGKGNAYMQPTKANLYTAANTFNLDVSAFAEANLTFPLTITQDADGKVEDISLNEDIDWLNYAMNSNNKGLGFDFGFIYKLNQSTTLSGSLLDLGFINWTSNPYKLQTSGSMEFNGLSNELNSENSSTILDSIGEHFRPYVTNETYTSTLTPTLYLGLTHDLNKIVNVGALYHTEIYRNRLHSSLSFSANALITDKLSTSASYTIQNNQFNNIGFGIGWQLGLFHLHAVSDNVPAFFALDEARNINLRFGVSFVGCPRERKKKTKTGAFDCPGDPYHAVHRTSSKRKKKKH